LYAAEYKRRANKINESETDCVIVGVREKINNLMFMGPCIVILFWYIIPTRCTSHRVYLI